MKIKIFILFQLFTLFSLGQVNYFPGTVKIGKVSEIDSLESSTKIMVWDSINQGLVKYVKSSNIGGGGSDTEPEIIRVRNKNQIVNQDLDPTKIYKIMNTITLTSSESIRTNNLKKLVGLGHNDTSIISSEENGVIFTTTGAGGGNVDIENIQLIASGTNAKVFDLEDVDGTHEVRLLAVNFSNCTSLGELDGFRQLYWQDIGIYGSDDGITLHGAWNGARVGNLNLFGFASTGTLFKQGTALTFSNRFFTTLNFDVPTGAKLFDFQPTVFTDNELLQINSSIAKVNGAINENNSSVLIPNISANNAKSLWVGNIGLFNSADERYVENTSVNSTYNINWLKDTYNLVLTGNTTFTESDLPASGKNSEEIKIYLQGNYVPTFPSGWTNNIVGTYKGTEINEITVKYLKSGLYFMKINNTLSVYPAPDLNNVAPVSLLPSQTQQLTLNGSFFTPATIVSIEGQTVNNIEFVSSQQLILSVTTGATEADFDITISNGTSVTFPNTLIVNLGDVFVPSEGDWTGFSTVAPDVSDVSTVKQTDFNLTQYARWTQPLDYTKDFVVRFNIKPTPLGEYPIPYRYNTIELVNGAGTRIVSAQYQLLSSGEERMFTESNGYTLETHTFECSASTNTNVRLTAMGQVLNPEFRYIGGVMFFYANGALQRTFSNVLSEDLYIKVTVAKSDLIDIKYIELPE